MSNEQDLAKIRDSLPPLWYAVYQGCLETGFSREQSFNLLQTFILSQGFTRPNQLEGPADNA